MRNIQVHSKQREEMVDITADVEKALLESGKGEGVCTVFVKHTTCGVTINENADPDVQHDILLFLRNLVPQYYEGFRHFEHNSDAHIKASIMGASVSVLFHDAKLLLGRWQGIYLCDFDGPRERTVVIHIASDK